ncbi:hypothetical protein BOX15_Mlig006811g1, partial [Macrostomum lignano]
NANAGHGPHGYTRRKAISAPQPSVRPHSSLALPVSLHRSPKLRQRLPPHPRIPATHRAGRRAQMESPVISSFGYVAETGEDEEDIVERQLFGPPPVKCKRQATTMEHNEEAGLVEPLEPLQPAGGSASSPAASALIGHSVTGIGQPLRRQNPLLQQLQRKRRPAAARDMCADNWRLDETARSHETVLLTPTSVLFHPRWSNGHAAVRANRPLDRGLVYYWEVTFGDRVFGTAMQVGVCTGDAQLHANEFLENLIGRDGNGWALSHKGLAWHNGSAKRLCEPFAENQSCIVGVLFDGPRGQLSFYVNGTRLESGFDGLDSCPEPLYPVLSSTAAKTGMSVTRLLRSYESLQDRCCAVLARSASAAAASTAVAPQWWRLPPRLRRVLADRFDVDCL